MAKPESFRLYGAYPNPFNRSTVIKYSLKDDGVVDLTVFDIMGREIKKIYKGYKIWGYYTASWDGTDADGREVPSGFYIVRIVVTNGREVIFKDSKKITLLK